MFTKEILGICTSCTIIVMVTSFPLDTISTKTGKIYKLVPLEAGSYKTYFPHDLQRSRRDVFPENINDQNRDESKEEPNKKAEKNNLENILSPTKQENNEKVGNKKEILKLIADTNYPVVYRVRRAYRNRRRYEDNDDYYDDSDYAGYDRKGAAVGYMDANDDFPTVVW